MIKTPRKLLFLEGPLVERIETGSSFRELYKYDNRYERANKSFGRYLINIGRIGHTENISFRVVDAKGKEISDEITVTDDKPISLPFKNADKTDYIELQTKTIFPNIELFRLEIEFI